MVDQLLEIKLTSESTVNEELTEEVMKIYSRDLLEDLETYPSPEAKKYASFRVFTKNVGNPTNWISSIHLLLLDLFFGINTKIWIISQRELPNPVEKMLKKQKALFDQAEGNTVEYNIIHQHNTEITKTILSGKQDYTSSYMEMYTDIRQSYYCGRINT
jgi:hypothetical protein